MSEQEALLAWKHEGEKYQLVPTSECECGFLVERYWNEPAEEPGWASDTDICAILPQLARLADLTRPRYPSRGELPEDGEEVVYQSTKGFRSMGYFREWTDGRMEFGDGTQATFEPHQVTAWWPVPGLPEAPTAGEPGKEE